jgi:MFS family permease
MAQAEAAAGAPAAERTFSGGYRAWLLAVLLIAYTLNFIDRTIVAVLAQPIKLALHLSDTQLGLLGGLAFAAVYVTLGIFLARLADRTNRVVLMGVAVAIWSAMTAAGGIAQSYLQLALTRMGVGLGEAGFLPTAQSLISDHFPPSRRATALGVFTLGIPLGSLIGAVTGGWIAQNLNWRVAFFVVGLPGLIVALLMLATFREPPRGLTDPGGAAAETPSAWEVLRRFASRPGVLWALAGATCASTAGYAVGAFLGAHLVRHFGMGYAQAGLVGGLIVGGPTCIGAFGAGPLSDLFGRRDKRAYALVPAAGLLFAAPLFAWAMTRPVWTDFFAFMLIGAAGQQFYLAPTFAVINNAMDARMRATAVAFMSVCLNLVGLGVGPLLAGALSDGMARRLAQGTTADLLNLCVAGAKGPCDAVATGLQYALLAMVGFYAVGAVCYLIAARTLKRDLEG